MRCSMCGHESPAGSSFCLNCGSSLAPALAPTQLPPQGLPAMVVCGTCRGENPPGMKFCRNCGSALAPAAAGGRPAMAAPMPGPPGPMPAAMAALGGPMPGMPSGPIGGFPSAPPAGPGYGPVGGMPGLAMEPEPSGARVAQGSTIACPRCGTQTPLGFAFCQQCGLNLQGIVPTEAASSARPRGPVAVAPLAGRSDGPIDPHAGTIAQDEVSSGAAAAARAGAALRPHTGPGWGTAVLVNRDGSDGQRYTLSGEYVVVGRAGADIAFDDDRFLARQHARLERGGDGVVRVHPIDALNGVFRKADAPIDLVDGTTLLVGREVLRFERIDPEEVKGFPLVRHGVALFGSPPREPWGRFVQLVPSGGYRDIRHLVGEEIVLGREEGDLVFRDDAFLSRRHAAVTWDGKRAQITDLGSSNGTFVRLIGPTVLRHGDHVRMGDQLLRVELGR
ncbi:MAG: FHA domain-containing protein [Deltaproteobacteria bacterium]|nr:MAG: FHA domain-containing protein [Deltaproteobacteria bacterium]